MPTRHASHSAREREAGVPAAARVELADQGEQPRGGGVEMGRQLGDLVAEAIELLDPRR
jgi:hypothetical protein